MLTREQPPCVVRTESPVNFCHLLEMCVGQQTVHCHWYLAGSAVLPHEGTSSFGAGWLCKALG